MGISPKYNNNKKKKDICNDEALIRLIKDIKVGEKMSNKEINAKEIIRQNNSPIKRQLPRVSSNFAKYTKFTSSGRHLPPFKSKSKLLLTRTASVNHNKSQIMRIKKSTYVSPMLSEIEKDITEKIQK